MYGRVEIDDETKRKLSLLLKYYRKKANLNQRDFITYNGATICSADTYSKIENCKIIKSNSIYHYLLVQIHAELTLPTSWWLPCRRTFQQLLELVTRYELQALAKQCEALLQLLSEKTDIFAREYRELLQLMISYYENCSDMSEEQYQKYMELYPVFDPSIQEIIKDMLYTYTVHRYRDTKKCSSVFHRLQMGDSTSLLNILNRSYQAYYEKRFLDCFRDSLYLEQQFLKQGNYNRLLDVYDAIVLLYVDVQKEAYDNEYVEKLFAIVRQHREQLHPNKYLQSLYQCGMLYYEIGQYEKACDYFCELATKDDYHYLPAALMACILCEKLNRPYPPEILRKPRYPKRFPQHVLTYHEYYRYKVTQEDVFKQEEYFLKHVLPVISNEDRLLWEPAQQQMEQLIRQTKHYHLKKRLHMN
ncbi:hypothetical protein MKA58_04340 [[Clostridium] innocuum]|nr:hypothetical protein [[Clostridium] innocuum]